MSAARRSLAGARILDLRTPLASVELAASQLERASGNPSSRALARRIRKAVEEMDLRIDDILPLLFDPCPRPVADESVHEVLDVLRDRLGPALAARGVAWELAGAPAESPRDEPHRIRRATLALLRAGAAWVGQGGRMHLALDTDPRRYALRLGCHTARGCAPPEGAFEALHDFAARHDGQLERVRSDDGLVATLWLARVDPCPAS